MYSGVVLTQFENKCPGCFKVCFIMAVQNDACTSCGLKHPYFNLTCLFFTLGRKDGGGGCCWGTSVRAQWPVGRESISPCVLCAELRYL